jgi:hypothetical protein
MPEFRDITVIREIAKFIDMPEVRGVAELENA